MVDISRYGQQQCHATVNVRGKLTRHTASTTAATTTEHASQRGQIRHPARRLPCAFRALVNGILILIVLRFFGREFLLRCRERLLHDLATAVALVLDALLVRLHASFRIAQAQSRVA